MTEQISITDEETGEVRWIDVDKVAWARGIIDMHLELAEEEIGDKDQYILALFQMFGEYVYTTEDYH